MRKHVIPVLLLSIFAALGTDAATAAPAKNLNFSIQTAAVGLEKTFRQNPPANATAAQVDALKAAREKAMKDAVDGLMASPSGDITIIVDGVTKDDAGVYQVSGHMEWKGMPATLLASEHRPPLNLTLATKNAAAATWTVGKAVTVPATCTSIVFNEVLMDPKPVPSGIVPGSNPPRFVPPPMNPTPVTDRSHAYLGATLIFQD